jgi:imidazolonepropionase-like amidohydrolase
VAIRTLALVIYGLLTSFGQGSRAEGRAEVMIVHAGWLLDVPGSFPKRKQTLIIEDGKISEVHAGYLQPVDLRLNANTRVIDLDGQFVTPGLIDCHVHLTSEPGRDGRLERVVKEDSDVAFRAAVAARRTLEAGFTTVRDLGAEGHAIFALRDAITAGEVPGPRILAAGNIISVTGGHGDIAGYRSDVLGVLGADEVTCDSADTCRKAVREEAKRGADVIKFAATGGVLSMGDRSLGQQMTDVEIEAIISTAHHLGRKVAVHAHDKGGIDAALRAGADSIEHATFADDASFKLFRQTVAYAVPTQMTIGVAQAIADDPTTPSVIREKARNLLPRMQTILHKLYEARVRLAFGTDAGTFPNGANAGEFRYLTIAGISPMEQIQMATTNAADLLGLSSEIGSLLPGKSADLIALSADPTVDTTTFEKPVFVMRAGVIYKNLAAP